MDGGPRRTCLGCRQVRPKAELLRLVRGEDGRVRVDHDSRAAGRGAYACPTVPCLGAALEPKRLGRAFRRPSRPPEESPAVILDNWRRR
ncbi:MAG TPA: YlxR family protein [Methylomirabilota bacterium]|nr:YlxR family protein [Methylomirabilota bacterium]